MHIYFSLFILNTQEFSVGKSQIRIACSVGSSVWLGTENGTLHVYCAMTYKQLCQGSIRSNRFGQGCPIIWHNEIPVMLCRLHKYLLNTFFIKNTNRYIGNEVLRIEETPCDGKFSWISLCPLIDTCGFFIKFSEFSRYLYLISPWRGDAIHWVNRRISMCVFLVQIPLWPLDGFVFCSSEYSFTMLC